MRNDMMPDGMAAKPGQGDLEESFEEILEDIDPAEKMPKPVPDTKMLGELREDTGRMLQALDREAVSAQQRADREAAMDITPAPDPSDELRLDDDIMEGF